MSRSEWEQAARAQHIRAERLQEQKNDLEHALNLFVNATVDWFASERTPDGNEHRFGMGVAMNVSIDDPLKSALEGRNKEHRSIVFWLTIFSEVPHKYLTIYELSEFKTLPERLEKEELENKGESKFTLIPLIRRAITLADHAYKRHVESRTPKIQ